MGVLNRRFQPGGVTMGERREVGLSKNRPSCLSILHEIRRLVVRRGFSVGGLGLDRNLRRPHRSVGTGPVISQTDH
jgi:hypothetical protein